LLSQEISLFYQRNEINKSNDDTLT
jgi:hypothetical protein